MLRLQRGGSSYRKGHWASRRGEVPAQPSHRERRELTSVGTLVTLQHNPATGASTEEAQGGEEEVVGATETSSRIGATRRLPTEQLGSWRHRVAVRSRLRSPARPCHVKHRTSHLPVLWFSQLEKRPIIVPTSPPLTPGGVKRVDSNGELSTEPRT